MINPRFFRHVVNPTSTTYQQGILAIEHSFHSCDAAGYVETFIKPSSVLYRFAGCPPAVREERNGLALVSELYFLVIPQRDCVAKLLNSPDCMGYALRFQPLLSLNVQPCHVLRFFRGVRENPN